MWAPFVAILALVADLVTIILVSLKLRARIRNRTDDGANETAVSANPLVVLPPPDDLPPRLPQMLKAAKKVWGTVEQATAMKTVAEHAVAAGDYDTAIEAGKETWSDVASSGTLRYVAIYAARAGRFEEAARAASEIRGTVSHDRTLNEILEIERRQRC